MSEKRSVTLLLGVGIFFIPLIFSWFTLRRGYTARAKAISFSWLVLSLVLLGFQGEKTSTPSSLGSESVSEFNFREMMIDRNDYSEELGTLRINSESPLDVVLLNEDMISQSEAIKREDVNRAIIYGIYRTFIHTKEPKITITARPLDIKSLNPRVAEENLAISLSLSVTKEQALEAIKRLLPEVKAFDDLIEVKMVGDMKREGQWKEEFGELYWQTEGLERLISALQSVESGQKASLDNTKREEAEIKKLQQKKTACQEDLSCWGDTYSISAAVYCKEYIERLAQYSHEWTDGILEPKFSHYRWKDIDKGVVTYIGDKIKFQNGFGAWQNHVYECDFNPTAETVLDVRAQAGRL